MKTEDHFMLFSFPSDTIPHISCTDLLLYDGPWQVQEGKECKNSRGSETTGSDIGSKRRGSYNIATLYKQCTKN